MEFCGRPHEYFNRVKAGGCEQNRETSAVVTARLEPDDGSFDFIGLRCAQYRCPRHHRSALHFNACGELPAPRCVWLDEGRFRASSQEQQWRAARAFFSQGTAGQSAGRPPSFRGCRNVSGIMVANPISPAPATAARNRKAAP
jgi:hypothetical protein